MIGQISNIKNISILTFLLIVINSNLGAQEKKEPSPRTIDVGVIQKDSLPKINLPEFVITGKEKIELPTEKKIEISENRIFISPPSSPIIISERDFSTVELETPQKNSTIFGKDKDVFNGFVKAGYGRFDSPFIGAGFFYNWDIHKIGFLGDYNSSKGHIPDADFNKEHFGILYGSELPQMDNIFNQARLKFNLNFAGEKFKFYGMPESDFWHRFKKNNDKYSFSGLISSTNIFPYDYVFTLDVVNYGSQTLQPFQIFNDYTKSFDQKEQKFTLNENSIETALKVSTDIDNWYLYGTLSFYYSNIDRADNKEFIQKYSEINLGIRKSLFSKLDIDLNLAYFMYKNMNSYDNYKFFPGLKIQYSMNPDLILFAQYQPLVNKVSFESAQSKFKYINDAVVLRHLINPIDISFDVDYLLNKVSRFTFSLNYFEQENTPIYRNTGDVDVISQIYFIVPYSWEIYYSNLKSINYTGDVKFHHTINQETEYDIKIKFIHSRVDEKKVPYTPAIMVSANLIHKFPFGLTLEPRLQYIGSRLVNDFFSLTDKYLDPYLIFDLNCEYQIIKNLRVFLYLSNILDQNYYIYENYKALPFMITAGFNFKW